ncbi:MAG: phosphatase PAP2 family protein [Azoarcus sp.]|jgi:membrane-associated phospholipid phosphatase|nr:phosphatase PAP2 family protein [Azoarcus sp.]
MASPFALLQRLDAWLILPILLCALCAGIVMATDSNQGLFLLGNAAAAGWLPAFAWAGITNTGSTLGAFALLVPALARWPRWVAATLLASPFASLYTHAIKILADVPRPSAVLPSEAIHIIGMPLRSNSFPSGHTLTVFVLAGVLTFCSRRPLAWFAVPVAALVAFSRIAVGAHWPLDLLGGAAGGWAAAAIGCAWSARWRFWECTRGQRVLAAIALIAAAAFGFETLDYLEGRWMQYLLCAWGVAGAAYALWRPAGVRHDNPSAGTENS